MSIKRVWIPSPNFSSRGGAIVRLIVLHTAEGALTIEGLGAFFQQSSAQVSSHVGADDKPGIIGEYVHAADKAWTVAAFNPVSVNIELCAFAAWSRDEWMKHPHMLSNCAQWIAESAAQFHLPIKALTPAEAQGSGRGVCQHRDLGTAGGGHHDCGPGFPYLHVLELARTGGHTAAAPPPGTGDANASVTCHLGRKTGIWEVHGTHSSNVHLDTRDEWEVAEIAVNRKSGKWRIHRTGRTTS
jgi:hypothetical protein